MTIGDRIKQRREQLQMTQDELAKRLGYKSRSSINKIELGQQNLTQSKIHAIATALETTPSFIMGWEEKVDSYSANFIRNLDEQMATINPQDFIGVEEAEADHAFLNRISDSSRPLTLEEACEAVNLLGSDVSLDEMVGWEKQTDKEKPAPNEEDRLNLEIMDLFLSLPEEKQKEALNYLHYLAESEGRK